MDTKANKQKSTQNLNITNSIEITLIGEAKVGEGAGGLGPPPHQNATNDKNKTQKSCFFNFSFF